MTPELMGIITTAIISGCDLGVNVITLLMSGDLNMTCCCFSIQHKDVEVELVKEISEARRSSVVNSPRRLNDEQVNTGTELSIATE